MEFRCSKEWISWGSSPRSSGAGIALNCWRRRPSANQPSPHFGKGGPESHGASARVACKLGEEDRMLDDGLASPSASRMATEFRIETRSHDRFWKTVCTIPIGAIGAPDLRSIWDSLPRRDRALPGTLTREQSKRLAANQFCKMRVENAARIDNGVPLGASIICLLGRRSRPPGCQMRNRGSEFAQ